MADQTTVGEPLECAASIVAGRMSGPITTVGEPLACAASIAQGRMSGPITTVATPLTCAGKLVVNAVSPSGLSVARNPEDVVTLPVYADGGCVPVTLRAVDALIGDGNLLTFSSHSETGPYTGNMFKVCTNFAATGITGSGAISGVIVHAYCRVTHDEAITISSPQFVMVGQTVAMTSPPHGVWGETTPSDCVSALLTTHDGAHEWTWDNIFAALAGTKVQVHVVYEGFGTPVTFDLSELWVEVYGEIGSVPEPIIMRQKIGLPIRKYTLGDIIEADQKLGPAVINKRMKFKATV